MFASPDSPLCCVQFTFSWVYGVVQRTKSSPPEQNGHHFADDIFKCIFMNEKFCISIRISLKFVPEGPIDNYIDVNVIFAISV